MKRLEEIADVLHLSAELWGNREREGVLVYQEKFFFVGLDKRHDRLNILIL